MNNKDSKRPSYQEVNCYIACVDKKLGMVGFSHSFKIFYIVLINYIQKLQSQ